MSVPDEAILKEYQKRAEADPKASRWSLYADTAYALDIDVRRVRETMDFYNSGLAG